MIRDGAGLSQELYNIGKVNDGLNVIKRCREMILDIEHSIDNIEGWKVLQLYCSVKNLMLRVTSERI